jgi:hypothetical protein
MAEIIPPWGGNDMPAGLVSAVDHLRTEFRGGHFKNGEITQQICFEILHFQGPVELCQWRRERLSEVESRVSTEAIARFDSLLGCGTHSSAVAAFFDLYVEAMNEQSVNTFHELLAIAFRNQQHINSAPLEWAKAQTNELFESKRHHIRRWVKDVCDVQWVPGQPLPMAGDFREWPSWEAPRFLIMEPLGEITSPVAQQEPFNSETAQERLDAIDTKFTLLYFEDRYTQKLRIALRRVAGEAAVHMAMHGVPPPVPPVRETEIAKLPEDAKVSMPTDKGKAAAPSKPAPKKTRANKRHEAIQAIILSGVEGIEYCKMMDGRGVKPPPEWLAQGWPGSYAAAYGSGTTADKQKWREKIQKKNPTQKEIDRALSHSPYSLWESGFLRIKPL